MDLSIHLKKFEQDIKDRALFNGWILQDYDEYLCNKILDSFIEEMKFEIDGEQSLQIKQSDEIKNFILNYIRGDSNESC